MRMASRVLWPYRWTALQPYEKTQTRMEQYALHVAQGIAQDQLWFLSHIPVYTQGRSMPQCVGAELQGIPVCRSSRGGDITYHGPEQRMIYPILALKDRGLRVFAYLDLLEQWIITCLYSWGVIATQDPQRRGVWVGPNKVCALGLAVKQGVAFHGMALNVYAAPQSFAAITPCGLEGPFGVISLQELGLMLSLQEVDYVLWKHCPFIA